MGMGTGSSNSRRRSCRGGGGSRGGEKEGDDQWSRRPHLLAFWRERKGVGVAAPWARVMRWSVSRACEREGDRVGRPYVCGRERGRPG